MKKMLFLMMACFLSMSLVAQEDIQQRKLAETKVEPPQFSGEIIEVEKPVVKKSPLALYIQENIVYPESAADFMDEGVVVVEFTVGADANVSNFIVTNSVSYALDNAVIDCLRKTDGMWIPGKVNGKFAPMEKSVNVMFDLEGTPTLTEYAKNYYLNGVRLYEKGEGFLENESLAQVKREKKASRRFNWSLNSLETAQKFAPEDPSIAYWQARNYEKLGDEEKMRERLNKCQQLIDIGLAFEYLKSEYDVAVVTFQRK